MARHQVHRSRWIACRRRSAAPSITILVFSRGKTVEKCAVGRPPGFLLIPSRAPRLDCAPFARARLCRLLEQRQETACAPHLRQPLCTATRPRLRSHSRSGHLRVWHLNSYMPASPTREVLAMVLRKVRKYSKRVMTWLAGFVSNLAFWAAQNASVVAALAAEKAEWAAEDAEWAGGCCYYLYPLRLPLPLATTIP